jgi:peptidoglycan/LPS O-acetylase OafA/YrhL
MDANPGPGSQVEALESLRGVAALMVVVYHLVELVHVALPTTLGFVKTHFGLGVPLFYALSGFVLSHGYQHRLESRGQVRAFFARRFFRIAPLFYAVVGAWLVIHYLLWDKVQTSQALFLNATFLYGLVPGAHMSIAWAGWSIGVEMLFYALFPFISLWATSGRSAWALFAGSLVFSAAVQNTFLGLSLDSYAYMNLGTQLPFFMVGVACSRTWADIGYPRSPRWSRILLLAFAAAAVVMVAVPAAWTFLYSVPMGNLEHNAWTLIFGALVLAAYTGRFSLLESGPLRRLGKLSFSVYLVHPLIMLAFIELGLSPWLAAHFERPLVQFLCAAVGAVACIWAASELTFRLIEQPGMALGRRVTMKQAPHAGAAAESVAAPGAR